MKIILFGYGKMGRNIERHAAKRGHEIILKINSENAGKIKAADLKGADLAIEFSKPSLAFANVMLCFEANLPVVSGTTGWPDKLLVAEKYCREHNKSFFYSTNYSLGVNLFFELNSFLAKMMSGQPLYEEILIHESHHIEKLDSPSGTAIALAGQIIHHIKRLKQWVNYKSDENITIEKETKGELPIFSTREDEIPGTHIIKYISDVDEIEIMHKAINRDGFALGALAAAEWLNGKKGVFGMKDLLKM